MAESIATCNQCGNIIYRRTMKKYTGSNTSTATNEQLEDMCREAEEQKAAGFLKLYCPTCKEPVEFDTKRIMRDQDE